MATAPCYTPAFVAADFLRVHPGGIVSFHAGASAQRVMDAINRMPPVTDWRAEAVLLLLAPRFRTVVFFFEFAGGCAVRQGVISRSAVNDFVLSSA